MSGRDAVLDQPSWQFGDYAEDGDAWLAHPEQVFAYVDFRVRSSPTEQWRRVVVVTHSWVRRQLAEGLFGAASWPSLLVVPDGTREDKRRWISEAVASGGPILEANSDVLPEGWQPKVGRRPVNEY